MAQRFLLPENRQAVKHEIVDGDVLLAASPQELQHGIRQDQGAFTESADLVRQQYPRDQLAAYERFMLIERISSSSLQPRLRLLNGRNKYPTERARRHRLLLATARDARLL